MFDNWQEGVDVENWKKAEKSVDVDDEEEEEVITEIHAADDELKVASLSSVLLRIAIERETRIKRIKEIEEQSQAHITSTPLKERALSWVWHSKYTPETQVRDEIWRLCLFALHKSGKFNTFDGRRKYNQG